MSVVAVVLSQPLRQGEAGKYLRSKDAERRLIVTRYLNAIEQSEFPPGTEFFTWSPSPKPPPSSRIVIGLSRLKRWIRGGSGIGLFIDRWARSAEWRMRYLDRAVAMIESRRASNWDLENPALVSVLENELSAQTISEIAVFDVFDLPAVLRYAETKECRVAVH